MTRRRVLAVASGGGHWIELLKLRPAFEDTHVTWVTVQRDYAHAVEGDEFKVVVDATRWNRAKLLLLLIQIAWILLRVRPDVVVSTGAAPGYFAIRLGGLLGIPGCWVDSIANAEELSLSGRRIARHARLTLSQWPDVAAREGVECEGAVL